MRTGKKREGKYGDGPEQKEHLFSNHLRRRPARDPTVFHVREAVFMFFNVDPPPPKPFASAKRHSRYSCSFPPPAFLPRPSRPPQLRSLRHPLCVLCVFLLRFPCAPLAPKIFSNRWKMREKFFQSLEKPGHFFQPLEKKVFKSLENRPFPGEPADCAGGKVKMQPKRSNKLFAVSFK